MVVYRLLLLQEDWTAVRSGAGTPQVPRTAVRSGAGTPKMPRTAVRSGAGALQVVQDSGQEWCIN